ncbi:unnamed protein product [Durusdinium trenchii]|uniref:HpcH/HpaI aldolase/citrate lyase domain-containing protein n=1 Tax=Durusdinium trenchii TaxID=1381693 RepID=A0ABP0KJV2_9DINO
MSAWPKPNGGSRLRELWRSASAGSPNSAVACWLHCADELTIEVLAQLDYDAYVMDLQHGTADGLQAIRQLRALQAMSSSAALVRLAELSASEVGRYLDAGFSGVICPMVNTKAQADALVAACRYAPQGERSWGPTRAMLKERVSLKGYAQQMRDPRTRPVTLAMIETRQGLGNLPDILTSEVDGVFIGPMDLSCSLDEEGLGTAGPKTSKAIARIKALAHRQGKVVGIYVSDRSSTEHYISKGFQFVVSAHDKVALMAGAMSSLPRTCLRRDPPAFWRVRTTHAGLLPVPQWLQVIWEGQQEPVDHEDYQERLYEVTVEFLRKQLALGLDEINDGGLSGGDLTRWVKRLSGFEDGPDGPRCCGAICYQGEALKIELKRLQRAAQEVGVPPGRVFFTSPAPGTLADAFGNDFYQSDEVFVNAIGAAMAKEYQAIHELGFKVQIDWLASTLTEGADRLAAQHQVQVLNGALQGLEAEQLRLQLRWEAPPSPALLQVLLEAEVKYVALETCQVERAPEEELWKKVKIPKDKVLLVGTINPCDRHVEHPRRIAQRLETFAEIVGWDRLMASTDAVRSADPARELAGLFERLQPVVAGAASVSNRAARVVTQEEMPQRPDCEWAGCPTYMAMGIICQGVEPVLSECYGYSLSYIEMCCGFTVAVEDGLGEILMPLDVPCRVVYGELETSLEVGEAMALPRGVVTHSVAVDQPSVQILRMSAGRSMTNGRSSDSEVRMLKYGDAAQRLHFDSPYGWLELEIIRLPSGQQLELDPRVDTVAVTLRGMVSCGLASLLPLQLVQQPSFLLAAKDSLVLVIKSSLPHDLDYDF